MTDEWGIDHEYEDAGGTLRTVTPVAVERLRALLDRPPEDLLEPLVIRRGDRPDAGRGTLVLEDGTSVAVDGPWPADVPLGYHLLQSDAGDRDVIVSPGRCHRVDRRAWGWAVQLYAARSRRSWGMGDLRDLSELAAWSAEEQGAGFVLVNPLQAGALTKPLQPSPYFPASRCFRSPLYLCVETVPGAADLRECWAPHAERGHALNSHRIIDREAVWEHKSAALRTIWERVRDRDGEFRRWQRRQPEHVRSFATWNALLEHQPGSWRAWAPELRDPKSSAVERFATDNTDQVDFHMWLQWCTELQLAQTSNATALMQDLPIGFDPDGFDAWRWQHVIAEEASVGAPPDELNTRGQDWGLPPFVPWRLRACGYRPFVEALRATMSSGGGLRIDHVMGLFRLWWVPRGAAPSDGAYVRYPARELLDVLALESHRAGAMVVGEDLGTVEDGVREELAAREVLSYRLLLFEEQRPDAWPERAMAAVTTHDLPTIIGVWTGEDRAAQRHAALEPNDAAEDEMRVRVARAVGADEPMEPSDVVVGTYRALAEAPSVLLCASFDDAALAAERPNMPGADMARPNWSIALAEPTEDIRRAPHVARIAGELARVVHQHEGG